MGELRRKVQDETEEFDVDVYIAFDGAVLLGATRGLRGEGVDKISERRSRRNTNGDNMKDGRKMTEWEGKEDAQKVQQVLVYRGKCRPRRLTDTGMIWSRQRGAKDVVAKRRSSEAAKGR